jgi:hypothetical protein
MDATVMSRYTGVGVATASAAAEPQRDLVMADALAHTFRSGQTPSFPPNGSTLWLSKSGPASRIEPACGNDSPRRTSETFRH